MNRDEILNWASSGDLGTNAFVLEQYVKEKENSIFVDIGVRFGCSSAIMSIDSVRKNNKIYGIDVEYGTFNDSCVSGENYTKLLGDSSTIGKNTQIKDLKKVDVLFIDSLHVREQVLCELYYWVPRLNENALIVFHDSHWPDGKKDSFGGKTWESVDKAIIEYFGLESLDDYSDEQIEVNCYPPSWGMTFIKIFNPKKFENKVKDWNKVFEDRNYIISSVSDEINSDVVEIDYELKPSSRRKK
jgi:hypothetical protein